MRKYKEFMKNMGILMLSNFSTRLLAFFLVPLYTAVLSTSEYGNYDIVHAAITLAFPVLTLDITEGAMRFLLDKTTNKEKIYRSSFGLLNVSILVVSALILLNLIFHFFPFIEEYSIPIILYYIAYAYNLSLQNITRGLDRIKDVGVSGIINAIFMLGLNILFLLVFKFGLNGYFFASIIANVISALYLLIRARLVRYVISIGKGRDRETREVVKYSMPLILNSLSWWINGVSDRYIVTFICGAAANGVYSVAYKIPSILSVVQSIFAQAWLISVTKEYKVNKDIKFVQKIYRIYNISLVILCSILILFNKLIATFLYKDDFYEAWQYVPFLLVSVVFAAVGSAISVVFSAEKDTKITARTTVCGAIMNIVLNFVLIPVIGVIGAAIATAVSSFTIWIVRWYYCRRYIKLTISFKDILSYIIIVFQAISFMFIADVPLYVVEGVSTILVLLLNMDILKEIISKIFKRKAKI